MVVFPRQERHASHQRTPTQVGAGRPQVVDDSILGTAETAPSNAAPLLANGDLHERARF